MRPDSPLDLDPYVEDTSELSIDSFVPPSPLTPATTRTTRPAEDEQIVNLALVLWLQTLTMFHSRIQAGGLKWSVKHLNFRFGEWEARTDGCLRKKREIMAIVEVKPFVRQGNLQIQEQESAQMSSWIRNFPDVGGWFVMKKERTYERRLLVSQDSTEIYLTVAEFEPAYKEYICREQQSKTLGPSFMTMNQYGPWNTLRADHMGQLGKLLLAFTLRCHETKVDTLRSERELFPPLMNHTKAFNERVSLAETIKKPAKPEATRLGGKLGSTSKIVPPSASAPPQTSHPPSTSQGPKPPKKSSLPTRRGHFRKPDTAEDPARPREH